MISRLMRVDRISLALFVLYCIEVGLFLLLAPWGPMWERVLSWLPSIELQAIAGHPLTRSAFSGFGLVHLIWSLHDLDLLIRRPSSTASASSTPSP